MTARTSAWSGAWSVLALVSVAASIAALTWRTWPHPFVDFGREVYTAWQLSEGKTLYRDIAYFNGPLSPVFNSLVFRAFGASLSVLFLTNAVLLGALLLVLKRSLGRLASGGAVLAALLVFTTVFAFGQMNTVGNNNYLSPYSHEMTHGLLLAVCTLGCIGRLLDVGALRHAFLVGVGTGGAFLTKPELFLAVAVAAIFALVMMRASGRWRWGGTARAVTAFLAGAVLPAGGALLWLASSMPADAALGAMLFPIRSIVNGDLRSLAFYEAVLGVDDVAASMTWMALTTACYGVVAGVAWVVGKAVSGAATTKARWLAVCSAFVISTAVAASVVTRDAWMMAFRGLPVVMLGLAVASVVGLFRSSGDPALWKRRATTAVWAVFALVLLSKVLLNAGAYHYGFVLTAVAALLLVLVLLEWLPSALALRGHSSAAFRAVLMGALCVCAWAHLSTTLGFARQRVVPVGTGADAFLASAGAGRLVNDVLGLIEERVGVDETVAVLPEGAMLNFLSRRPNPTPYISAMPPELILFGEADMREAFERTPPDYVVLLPRDVSEYGCERWGTDVGASLSGHVSERYEAIADTGTQGPTASLWRLRRP